MTDKVADLTARRRAGRKGAGRGRACPICGNPTVAAFRPFCSRRCADVDLGRWLKESYRVPTAETPEDGDGEPDRGEG